MADELGGIVQKGIPGEGMVGKSNLMQVTLRFSFDFFKQFGGKDEITKVQCFPLYTVLLALGKRRIRKKRNILRTHI